MLRTFTEHEKTRVMLSLVCAKLGITGEDVRKAFEACITVIDIPDNINTNEEPHE